MELLQQPPLPPQPQLFFDAVPPAYMQPPLPMGPPPPHNQSLPGQPPLPAGPHQQQQQGPPLQQQPPQQQQQGAKRKKRGRRGSGLEARSRGMKQRGGSGGGGTQLGFFGQVPSLDDLRQENWRRTQQHYGGGGSSRPFLGPLKQPHGSGRPGGHRRARGKVPKQPKMPLPTPRPTPLTPAVGNPLDTPANVGKPSSGLVPRKLEVEGLQEGLDWYGTNENSTALFLTGQQLTTSDSEGDGDGEDGDEYGEGEEGSENEGGNDAAGGARGDGGPVEDAALPRHLQARLVEQEAYIAELEDQNLRLREQLEMMQQEVEELRARGGGGPADSEEGFAEHSEGSLPGDLSVMHHHHSQHHHSQHHHSQAM